MERSPGTPADDSAPSLPLHSPMTNRSTISSPSLASHTPTAPLRLVPADPTGSAASAMRRFQEELEVYRMDAQHLTGEKCAERCRTLSVLLTIAMEG